jgi:hypothetical protein
MSSASESLNSKNRAPNAMWFLPTRCWQREEMVLLTYGNGDGWGKVGDGEVAQASLRNIAGVLWWSSSSRDGSDGGNGGMGSSSNQLFSGGGFRVFELLLPC